MVEPRAIQAGLAYCAVVFAAGLVFGLMRSHWVTPLAGELVAVMLEAPVLLAIAWSACGWIAERFDVAQQFLDRLVMGGVALAVLICAEAVTALLLQHASLLTYFAAHGRSAVLLGLLVQLAFAVFPMIRQRRLDQAGSGNPP
ncbi:hypothetical protein LJR219_001432 [Phenylobacterium sp. LjRoot219]|uniref:hypothetical protein n=1 Tax=Phenylobacterium sp. LjRoot219 TaxID=3342283 RepID=UPI003ECCFC82